MRSRRFGRTFTESGFGLPSGIRPSEPHGAAIIAHSGGPTAVLNASLAGVIDAARAGQNITRILAPRFGVRGLLSGDLVDLSFITAQDVERLSWSPGSAIGSSRQALREEDFDSLLQLLERHNVRFFFYTGGNGSMETALRIHQRACAQRYDLQVIGIPKTIDNDLAVTDHSPGHASAARFFAHAVRDIGEDNRSLPSPVCVVESLGRNAGWIAASTSLARYYADDAPHLIYFPERPVSEDRLAADVETVFRRLGRVVVVACEGQLNERGEPFGADVDRPDSNVHRLASNLGHTLAGVITRRTGLRARAEKPGLLGRSCSSLVSEVDRAEAYECGRAAVAAACRGESGKMIALQREPGESYRSSTFLAPLADVARTERLFPAAWIAPSGNDVTKEYLSYIVPLAGETPPHYRLEAPPVRW